MPGPLLIYQHTPSNPSGKVLRPTSKTFEPPSPGRVRPEMVQARDASSTRRRLNVPFQSLKGTHFAPFTQWPKTRGHVASFGMCT